MSGFETVYVLHKSGAKSHYKGLEHLLQQNGGRIVYREFSVVDTLIKSIIKLKFALAKKQFINAWFLLSLSFSKDKKVVLGIAPFDYKLPYLLYLLKNHKVFYHTSWTVWDGSHQPKNKWVTDKLKSHWRKFLEEDAKHIFAVSNETQIQLMANYHITNSRISVVYHSLDDTMFKCNGEQKIDSGKINFIYVGRLVSQKGLEELLDYFATQTDKVITIIGKGTLQPLVQDYAKKHAAIRFLGYINNPEALAKYYREHDYLVLNSKKTQIWEEAFGMVLIEAMACGTIAVSTNHSGPQEIIDTTINGYLIPEGTMVPFLDNLKLRPAYDKIKQKAIETAKLYSLENIAKRWLPVLN